MQTSGCHLLRDDDDRLALERASWSGGDPGLPKEAKAHQSCRTDQRTERGKDGVLAKSFRALGLHNLHFDCQVWYGTFIGKNRGVPQRFIGERVLFASAHEGLPGQSGVDDVLDVSELERPDLVTALPRCEDLVDIDHEHVLQDIHLDAFKVSVIVRGFACLKNSDDRHAGLSKSDEELYHIL